MKTPQNLNFIIETLFEIVVFIQARIIATASSYSGAGHASSTTLGVEGGEKGDIIKKILADSAITE